MLEEYKSCVNLMKNTTGRRLKFLYTDNGSEFVNEHMRRYNQSKGIIHQTTIPYCPQQNGIAERMIGWVHKAIKKVLAQARFPVRQWHHALKYVVYTRNRILNRYNQKQTPYELMFGKKPDLKGLLPFGCIGYCLIPSPQVKPGGFSKKAIRCRFLCYDRQPGCYQVLIEGKQKPVRVKHAIFDENRFSWGKTLSQYDKVRDNLLDAFMELEEQRRLNPENIQSPQSVSPVREVKQQLERKAPFVTPNRRIRRERKQRTVYDPTTGEMVLPSSSRILRTSQPPSIGPTIQRVEEVKKALENKKVEQSSDGKVRPDPGQNNLIVDQVKNCHNIDLVSTKNLDDEITHDLLTMSQDLVKHIDNEPRSYKEALQQGSRWDDAHRKELDAMHMTGTWSIVKGHKVKLT